jgi:NitT/TauT family transport system substrate-binding protein
MGRTARSVWACELVVLAVGVAVPACSSRGTSGADHVTAVVLPFLSQMPLHVAAEEGYFADEGLDVELRRLGRNQDIMTILAHGDVDVAAGMLTLNELSLVEAGARLRVVAALGEAASDGCTFAAIVVRREHVDSAAITDPERIRHFRFDANEFIPLGYAVDQLLRDYSLSFDDVDTVDLPPPAALDALERGLIDASVDAEPWISMEVANGTSTIWRAVGDLIPHYVHSVLLFGPTLVDDRPDVGERFMVAVLKAVRQLRQGKTPRNVALVQKATGLTREEVERACWPSLAPDGRVAPSSFRAYQEWSVERGLLPRVLADEELFDDRFVEQANARLLK